MAWLSGCLFAAGFVSISVLGLLLVHRLVPLGIRQQHNDVAGFIYAVVGVIYGVLLAFAVILVWERYQVAEEHVAQEATVLTDLFRDAAMLSATNGEAVRSKLRAYAESVVAREWQAMTTRQVDPETQRNFQALWATLRAVRPEGVIQETWYGEFVTRMNNAGELRMLRIEGSRGGIPTVIWPPLILGAMAVIGFTYLFGTINLRAHVLMVGMLALVISLSIFLVWALQNPYRGVGQLAAEPFEDAIELFDGLAAPGAP